MAHIKKYLLEIRGVIVIGYYLLGIIVIGISCFVSISVKRSALVSYTLLLLGILVIAYFFSIRAVDAGSDTIFYYDAFLYFDRLSLKDVTFGNLSYGYISQEKLFSLITKVLSLFFDFDGYLFVLSMVSAGCSALFYEKVIGRNFLFVFLMFACGTTIIYLFGNTLRQGLALPLAFIASWYFYSGRKFVSAVILFACLNIHSSTLLFMFIAAISYMTVFYSRNLTIDRLFIYFALFIPIILMIKVIASLGFGGVFFNKLTYYAGGSYEGVGVGMLALIYPLIFFIGIYFIFEELSDYVKCLAVAYGFFFMTQLVFIDAAEVFYRIGMYRFFIEPILFWFIFQRLIYSRFSGGVEMYVLLIPSLICFSLFYSFTRPELLITLGIL